jgi:hypothetical protein
VERMGLICFKALLRHLCAEVRKTTKHFGTGVRLSQLYCASRKAKGSFDTLRVLEYFLRCLRIW